MASDDSVVSSDHDRPELGYDPVERVAEFWRTTYPNRTYHRGGCYGREIVEAWPTMSRDERQSAATHASIHVFGRRKSATTIEAALDEFWSELGRVEEP
jgi:hypothetical protein